MSTDGFGRELIVFALYAANAVAWCWALAPVAGV